MDAFTGMVASFGFTFAPQNWAFCSGQVIAISQNQALYSLIGTYFGGNGSVTFGYPDLRGRTPVGSSLMGTPPGLAAIGQGQLAGAQQVTLSIGEMPTHSHAASFTPGAGSPVTVDVQASTNAGTKRTAAGGDYIAGQAAIGSKPDIYVDAASAGTTVPLGGVTASGGGGSGTVSVGTTGNGSPFWILNPAQGVTFSICENGIYPSRN